MQQTGAVCQLDGPDRLGLWCNQEEAVTGVATPAKAGGEAGRSGGGAAAAAPSVSAGPAAVSAGAGGGAAAPTSPAVTPLKDPAACEALALR